MVQSLLPTVGCTRPGEVSEMQIEQLLNVGVVGCGLMGRQIGLNTAMYGYEVTLTDISPETRAAAAAWAVEYMDGRVAKGRLTREQADAALARFHVVDDLEQTCRDAGLVIEAVIEDRATKTALFSQISGYVATDAIVATNSSYMPSSMFRDYLTNPERLANIHYFSPALVMKVVEVVKGEHTSEATAEFLLKFAERTGKVPILLRKEIDGFIVNRILRAIKDEAYNLLEQGIASAEDIDRGVELGLNHPMGPFRLTDFTGIDLNYMANERRLVETGIKPPGYDIVKQKYDAHEWGRKTGKGFYDYGKPS